MPGNVRVKPVIKIIALHIQLRANDIIIIDTPTPGGVDTAILVTGKTQCRGIITRNIDIDITPAALLHSCQFSRKIQYVHKREAFGIDIISHAYRRHLPGSFE